MSDREPISSREVSQMLSRYSQMVAAQAAIMRVDCDSRASNLLDDEAERAEELAAYFWDSKHNLREHYVSRFAVLGDLYIIDENVFLGKSMYFPNNLVEHLARLDRDA